MDFKQLAAKLFRDDHLFDPIGYGRIFAVVDFANVRYWAKSFWPEDNKEFIKRGIDIEKLANLIDTVSPERKFFYYGYYKEHPELPYEHENNVRYRKSIYRLDKAAKCGFTKRAKEIKEISDFNDEGKYIGKKSKCNCDVEIAMDLLLKIDKYDTVFAWTGDSDFNSLFQHLKSKKKKIISVCARDFASEELRKNSDLFIPADPFAERLEYVRKPSK